MSLYSENYSRIMDGYNKILDTIKSVEQLEQLECIPNMIDNWIKLVDKYCNDVFYDKTNPNRKKDAPRLGEVGMKMFEVMKQLYQDRVEELTPPEYNGLFKPKRVKSLQEIAHE